MWNAVSSAGLGREAVSNGGHPAVHVVWHQRGMQLLETSSCKIGMRHCVRVPFVLSQDREMNPQTWTVFSTYCKGCATLMSNIASQAMDKERATMSQGQ